MNTEVIAHCVSIPQDDRFYLDFHVYDVKFLPQPELGCLPNGEGRELLWRGIFMTYEIQHPIVPKN